MSDYPDPIDVEQERIRAAASRSYVIHAVLVLVLYFVMWLPGFIANIVFYMQASSDERLIGRPPEGKGCLTGLLIFGIVLPVLGICLAVLFLFGAVGSLAVV
jgi:hypothetical protein